MLILVTELLSKFDLITKNQFNYFGLFFYTSNNLFLLNYKIIFFKLKIIYKNLLQEKIIIIPIIFILIVTFLISLFYVPGTPDAMSYHLTRVMV